jgi:ABC-type phosphate/phosphonate transport system ATPase subunit
MLEKGLLLFELLQAKHGVIILGEADCGKTTLIRLLEHAFNKSSANEMQVLIEERKRAKLNAID